MHLVAPVLQRVLGLLLVALLIVVSDGCHIQLLNKVYIGIIALLANVLNWRCFGCSYSVRFECIELNDKAITIGALKDCALSET